jgi:nucleoside permease NupC
MLIVFVALIHLVNAALGLLPGIRGPITLQGLLGFAMAPICWTLGVPWAEASTAGALLGTKTVLNEIRRIPRYGQYAAGRARPPLSADHDLCIVRFREFRQRWDHDCRAHNNRARSS